MIIGGVEVVFVTVTVPLAFVTTRIGATTTRAVPAARTVEVAAVVDDAVVVVVAACDRRRLPRGGLAARVGLGVTADVSVGVRTTVPAPLAADVGVVVIAAVVGVAVVLVSVGVVMIAAVVGVAVVAAIVGATVVAAAVVPFAAVEPMTTAPLPSPVMTGIGSELMDAFTVACGLAYADGGMNWPVGGACAARLGCASDGLIVPRNRSR